MGWPAKTQIAAAAADAARNGMKLEKPKEDRDATKNVHTEMVKRKVDSGKANKIKKIVKSNNIKAQHVNEKGKEKVKVKTDNRITQNPRRNVNSHNKPIEMDKTKVDAGKFKKIRDNAKGSHINDQDDPSKKGKEETVKNGNIKTQNVTSQNKPMQMPKTKKDNGKFNNLIDNVKGSKINDDKKETMSGKKTLINIHRRRKGKRNHVVMGGAKAETGKFKKYIANA